MGVFAQIRLPRDARNLMDRLLCDVDDRLGSNGIQELKVGLQNAVLLGPCLTSHCSPLELT